ncbi:hypothetical protein V461_18265 [Pantoea ananatis BRT98]|nr:hypothetical protein V461_18265 [Pantoea ananatis BRT98]
MFALGEYLAIKLAEAREKYEQARKQSQMALARHRLVSEIRSARSMTLLITLS